MLVSGGDYFYPRPPCGGRRAALAVPWILSIFLSTPSLRRATLQTTRTGMEVYAISIHALLAEGDISQSRPIFWAVLFLSTPSLRRATCCVLWADGGGFISIHALLAEGDAAGARGIHGIPISIHALLAEGDLESWPEKELRKISIHALLAEGDYFTVVMSTLFSISIHALLAEGDLHSTVHFLQVNQFLSTPSLRRATVPETNNKEVVEISIHALLAEGDPAFPGRTHW